MVKMREGKDMTSLSLSLSRIHIGMYIMLLLLLLKYTILLLLEYTYIILKSYSNSNFTRSFSITSSLGWSYQVSALCR